MFPANNLMMVHKYFVLNRCTRIWEMTSLENDFTYPTGICSCHRKVCITEGEKGVHPLSSQVDINGFAGFPFISENFSVNMKA